MALPWLSRSLAPAWRTDPELDGPFAAAESWWQRWRRDPELRAFWWKVMALGNHGLMWVAMGVIIALNNKPMIDVFYVHVTEQAQVLGVEKMGGKPYNPEEQWLRFLAQEWVRWVWSIPLDETMLKANWHQAQGIATGPVNQQLYQYAKAIELEDLVKKGFTAKVEVQSVLTKTERVFEVAWLYTTYNQQSGSKTCTNWVGELELIVRKPTTQKELDVNPLGVWVGRYTWTKQAPKEKPCGDR
jgi:type IV secretory pathway TrbF-like protein